MDPAGRSQWCNKDRPQVCHLNFKFGSRGIFIENAGCGNKIELPIVSNEWTFWESIQSNPALEAKVILVSREGG